jgi:tetratricopeptide (TPR) repeat protein
VALGFLRDCRSGRLGPLDPALPIDVVELAAGPGHFGYLFLRALLSLQQGVPELAPLRLRFVMTDLAPANVEAWAASDRLRPFAEQGVLEFGVLDAQRGEELRLQRSGETLRAGAPRNPTLLIANYLFDSLPQDLFWVQDKELVEGAVTLRSDREEDLGQADAALLARLELAFEPRPAARPCYDDPLAERVLEGYRQRLRDGSFLFPVGALGVLRNVGRLFGPRTVVLAADKGEADESELPSRGTPRLTLHGGFFSLGVDFNALGLYAKEGGGDVLHSPGRDRRLRVAAFLLGGDRTCFAETRLAFGEAVGRFSPLDYFALSHQLRRQRPAPPPETSLALLPGLAEQAAGLPGHLRRDLLREVERAWEEFFPMGEDVPFELGRLSARLGQPLEALRYFVESLRRFGVSAAALFNAGLCLYALGEKREALRLVEKAVAVDPSASRAREWGARIRAELDPVA